MVDNPHHEPSDHRGSVSKASILIVGAFLMLLAVLLGWAISARFSRASRVTFAVSRLRAPQPELLAGERACRACHPGESAQHSRSGHARTLRPAAARSLARL